MRSHWALVGLLLAVAPAWAAQVPAPHPRPAIVAKMTTPALPPGPKFIPFQRGVSGMKSLSPKLRAIRTKMLRHRAVSYRELQALADANDGLAAMFLAGRIAASGDPRSLSGAVLYYSVAAFDGRASATKRLVSLLGSIGATLKPGLLKQARGALEAQAAHHNPDAVLALARFYGEQPIFGDNPAAAKSYLAIAAEGGSPKAALALALLLAASGTPPEADRVQAVKYLGLAKRLGDVGTVAIADNLIQLLNTSSITPSLEATP